MSSETSSYQVKTAEILREGIKPEEVMAVYDDWAENFEEIINEDIYNAPLVALEEILGRVSPDRRANTRILDLPAGTGWLGAKLYNEGFRHIDALEPSKGMLKKLKEKGVYTNVYSEIIGAGHCSIPSATYDLSVSLGGWTDGQIPVGGLDELVRVTKKGGLVMMFQLFDTKTATGTYTKKLVARMEELERKGTWTKVDRRDLPKKLGGALLLYRVA